jgi:hypothetical protein
MTSSLYSSKRFLLLTLATRAVEKNEIWGQLKIESFLRAVAAGAPWQENARQQRPESYDVKRWRSQQSFP